MDMLPDVFAGLAGKVNFVARITDNEYHSSCPRCGGGIHEDGSFSDRFVMWLSSRRGEPFGLCRKCGYKWSPKKADVHWSPSERLEFERKTRELEKAYFEKKSRELAILSEKIQAQAIYQKYHEEALGRNKVMAYYESLLIPSEWVGYLKLGYIPDYQVRGRNSTYKDSGFTFPIWSLSRIENIKVRVEHPINSADRYRNLYKSGCQHLYTPVHESDVLASKIVVMEGEKKAIVAHINGGLPEDVQVVGIQSVMPEKRVVEMLNKAEVVYLALDPDAYVPNEVGTVAVLNIVKQIGKERCRLILPPRDTKFDDAIILGFKFRNAFNMAVKAGSLRH